MAALRPLMKAALWGYRRRSGAEGGCEGSFLMPVPIGGGQIVLLFTQINTRCGDQVAQIINIRRLVCLWTLWRPHGSWRRSTICLWRLDGLRLVERVQGVVAWEGEMRHGLQLR